ncbi:MAG: DUF1294 domain-containing protein [Myxococcales bacterium]|nr:DUF1294 domain-containing protein [Myxococcales bacterium]
MNEDPDMVELLLSSLLLLWHGAAVVAVAKSNKLGGSKIRWIMAILLLPPFGLGAWLLSGRKEGRRYLGVTGYLTIAVVAVALLLGLTRRYWPGYEYFAWITAWSLVTFFMYLYDKLAAGGGKDDQGNSQAARVNENALHLFALLGGFVGGWIGRHALRHKTKKPAFGFVLAMATALHLSKIFGLW